jgi:hypothetical protein
VSKALPLKGRWQHADRPRVPGPRAAWHGGRGKSPAVRLPRTGFRRPAQVLFPATPRPELEIAPLLGRSKPRRWRRMASEQPGILATRPARIAVRGSTRSTSPRDCAVPSAASWPIGQPKAMLRDCFHLIAATDLMPQS